MGRCLLSKDDADGYGIGFSKIFDITRADCSSFEVGKTLRGIVIDWSDAEASGLRKAVGATMANGLLRGCQVNWARSYQRVADKVCRTAEEKRAFNTVASCIPCGQSKSTILLQFQVLCGEKPVESLHLHGLHPFNNSHWRKAKAWVEWWTRQYHVQMLCKEFSPLNDDDWRDCPKDTNAVERKNRDSKMTNTASLRSLLIALYKSDKSCAYQYMAAIRSGDLTYNRTDHEARLKSAKVRREQRKRSYPKDSECQHGPPDKQQHFAAKDTSLLFKEVDVKYSDGVWYRGRITAFDEKTAKWTVYFASDGETTDFSLPDPDVRIVGDDHDHNDDDFE